MSMEIEDNFIKESQNRTVLAHLQKYGTITSIQAIRLYGITRLSGRIYDLKQSGNATARRVVFHPENRSIHWVEYSLV